MHELIEPRPSTLDEVIDIRRHLHRHPEVSFDEHQTSHLIARRLESYGLTLHPCPTETGAVATLDGGKPGRTILIRADIDALPIQEESGVDFQSGSDGRMHACGHDAHTAILLGVAKTLAEQAEDLPGRYLFVFQPAEEVVSGARQMIANGLLEQHPADFAIGLHLAAWAESGHVITKPGLLWGGSDAFEITFLGPGGHGGMMGRAGNVINAQAFLVERLMTVVEGLEWEDGTPCHTTIGDVRTDGAWNIVPRHALVKGSLRTFTEKLREVALQRLADLLLETETEFSVDAQLKLVHGTVPLINHPTPTDIVMETARELIGEKASTLGHPLTVSDDVAEFLTHIPGCYFQLGAKPPELEVPTSHHSPFFRIDEAAFATGVRVLAGSAVRLAERDALTEPAS
ncbi:MAG TPA: M20 family metallopeptidase [Candidatus Dormibacteraeota bacterium]|nr:M20 family metallopeptidase [Candidatus Dormibacteraeota bacterium]